MKAYHADLILVGAGLSNCILAWLVRRRHPNLRVLIFEEKNAIPPRRTWSFHRSDVEKVFSDILPLVSKVWPSTEIELPGFKRPIEGVYASIRPEKLQSELAALLGENLVFNARVDNVARESVTLSGGEVFTAPCVLDARNDRPWPGRSGYQKFAGLHVTLKTPHGLDRPILMDARIPQTDGYRFFYTLPWDDRSLLIEDTRYSSNPTLDTDLYRTEIENYAQARGWSILAVNGSETGVLNVPLSTAGFSNAGENKTGVAGGFFHPVTGYSLPFAVELADRISSLDKITAENVFAVIKNYRSERASAARFLCVLNRMMFGAAEPDQRFKIFEHFYTLPNDTIRRFYAGKLSATDRLRILCGNPPVKISAAIRSLVTEGPTL